MWNGPWVPGGLLSVLAAWLLLTATPLTPVYCCHVTGPADLHLPFLVSADFWLSSVSSLGAWAVLLGRGPFAPYFLHMSRRAPGSQGNAPSLQERWLDLLREVDGGRGVPVTDLNATCCAVLTHTAAFCPRDLHAQP